MAETVQFITGNFGQYDLWQIQSYQAIGGFSALEKAFAMGQDDLIELMKQYEVKGRGGAAYDLGRKWHQAREIAAEYKVVVCNADEGEPCTFKDRTLIENDPFRLIEAMTIAGFAVGAQNGYIYLREEYTHLRPLLLNAIAEANQARLLGDNILGRGFSYQIHLYSGAGAYVCGEGTALVESMEGKIGQPRTKPPYIKQCGYMNLPTCVNNVESFYVVPAIINDTDKSYYNCGVAGARGSKMISIAGHVNKPGAYEIPFGLSVGEILEDLAGGVIENRKIGLIQFGGASGKISDSRILSTPYTYEDLKKAGVDVGSGAILVIDEQTNLETFLLYTQQFFVHESCGKCVPCRIGTTRVLEMLQKWQKEGLTSQEREQLRQTAQLVQMTSLCGLGQAAHNGLLTAMNIFPEKFSERMHPSRASGL